MLRCQSVPTSPLRRQRCFLRSSGVRTLGHPAGGRVRRCGRGTDIGQGRPLVRADGGKASLEVCDVTWLVGQSAAPFSLPDAHGQERRLEDYPDRWLLLVFHRHLF